MTIISDLSPELVDEILSRTPLTSLQAVRSTSKQWNASSKTRVVCKARTRDQFLGFMKMDSKVSSVRFQGEVDDLSIKQVAKLNQFQIYTMFHCNGLVLCVSLDLKKLVIWNPYLNQTRIIKATNTLFMNYYGIGYDSCGRYKILSFSDCFTKKDLGDSIVIYDFDSNSWRGLDVNPDWDFKSDRQGVSVKGRSYWIAGDRIMKEEWEDEEEEELRRFLLYFDYTKERFGPHLKLPVKEYVQLTCRLSGVREEQLALLCLRPDMMEIWMTTKIEFDNVSWSKLLVFDMTPSRRIWYTVYNRSFVIDEDKKVAMFFGSRLTTDKNAPECSVVYIIGEDGYFKEVDLERSYWCRGVCSYVPSLVQIEETARGKSLNVVI